MKRRLEMALFRIRSDELKNAIDGVLNGSGVVYTIRIKNGSTVIDTSTAVDFTAATYDAGNERASANLTTSKFFAIDSGTTIDTVEVVADATDVMISESITPRVYSSAGSFTVSNIIGRLGV
jgi:hypothetical protein